MTQKQKKIEIVTVAGTRPEIIKLADLIPKLNNAHDHTFVYTGQHYSKNMKDIFFDELNLNPNYDLKCNTSEVNILRNHIKKTLKFLKPSYVIVYGDTSSAMAGALAAKDIGCSLIHLEAGVRDFDLTVPEESIRISIDANSEYLFTPSEFCNTVLKYEDISGKVFLTGNLIVDVCRRLSKIPFEFKNNFLKNFDDYLLLTLHRPENSDDPMKLKMLKKHLANIKYKIIFPIHPRTKKNLERFNISLPQNVKLIEAAGYLEFLELLKNCRLVLTDSGGVQEEAIVLTKPCITLRHTSARWETILLKANILFPLDRRDSLNDVVETMMSTSINRNPYGENVTNLTAMKIKKILQTSKNIGARKIN